MNSILTDGKARSGKPGLARRIFARVAAASVERRLAAILMALGSACAIATCYALFHSWSSQVQAERVTTYLLTTDVAITLALAGIVIRRLFMLWLSRRRGQTGAKLHARLVLLFALIAVIPTVVVSTFSTAFLNRGLDSWFSQRIQDAVGSSVVMVESYRTEQQLQAQREAAEIAQEVQSSGVLDSDDPVALNGLIGREVWNRNLTQALVITRLGQVRAGGGRFGPQLLQRSDLKPTMFDAVDLGSVEADQTETGVRALASLGPGTGLYLYIGKAFDPRISRSIEQNRNAVQLYHQIENARSKLQITVGLIFAVLALLVLTAAIWVAIVYATQLVKPISRLALAAEQIGGGDLSARVKIGLAEDDLSALSRTFNVMAIQLQSQQHALIAATGNPTNAGDSPSLCSLAFPPGSSAWPTTEPSTCRTVPLRNFLGQLAEPDRSAARGDLAGDGGDHGEGPQP